MSNKEKKEPIKVTKSQIKELVDSGKSKEEISKELNLNMSQTNKLLKEANLKTKRQITPSFTLVDDTKEEHKTAFNKPSKAVLNKVNKEDEEEASSIENEW